MIWGYHHFRKHPYVLCKKASFIVENGSLGSFIFVFEDTELQYNMMWEETSLIVDVTMSA